MTRNGNNINNRGFIKLLIIIIIAILILSYFNIDIKGIVSYIVEAFKNVF